MEAKPPVRYVGMHTLLEKAAARIAAGTAHPGTLYTADADTDGQINKTESDAAECVKI